MATTFKTFLNNDITSTRTLLHESIPLTGSIASGTYGTANTALGSEPNIKNYAHGIFQSVYDYPYLSSSANHLYDITLGYSHNSVLSKSAGNPQIQQSKKINIYNQMAQVLMGHDATGGILRFDHRNPLIANSSDKMNECIFFNFSRLITKDEIKKGSFQIKLATGSFATPFAAVDGDAVCTIDDSGAENDYRVSSPAGEYGILSMSVGSDPANTALQPVVGLIFYQAGIAVLSGSVFTSGSGGAISANRLGFSGPGYGNNCDFPTALTGVSISSSCNFIRHRLYNVSFNNTTELNSTIHFCRVNHNDFNYSSNPTYLSESKMRVKNNTLDSPVSYFPSVGLYSADNELLAVSKLSEPLKKDPTNEMTIRVRLDY